MKDLNLDQVPEEVEIRGCYPNREIFLDGKLLDPHPSQIIRMHSPDGFNWGYCGSGPAQLALAILLKFLPASDAQWLYQEFKFSEVASWPGGENFKVTINLREILMKQVLYK